MKHTRGLRCRLAGTLGAGRGSCRMPPVVFFSFIWDSPRFGGAFSFGLPNWATVFPQSSSAMGSVSSWVTVIIESPYSAPPARGFSWQRNQSPRPECFAAEDRSPPPRMSLDTLSLALSLSRRGGAFSAPPHVSSVLSAVAHRQPQAWHLPCGGFPCERKRRPESAHALANLKRAAVSSEVRYELSAPMSAAPLSRPSQN
jgi:hypothetical protein